MQNVNNLINFISAIPSEYHILIILCLCICMIKPKPIAETIIIGDVHLYDNANLKKIVNSEE